MLQFGDVRIESRLIVGTGKYPSLRLCACHEAAQTELVTVALRRLTLARQGANILDFIDQKHSPAPQYSGLLPPRCSDQCQTRSKALEPTSLSSK